MSKSAFSLMGNARDELAKRFLNRKTQQEAQDSQQAQIRPGQQWSHISDNFCRFDKHPGFEKIMVPQAAANRLGLANPFFKSHDGVASATTQIAGRTFINFSSYNYLGLSGHPKINKAAKDAIDRYGTSTSASRLVAGERPVQRELEEALAELHDVEDCVVFVSGHATNVSTIGYLFGPKDLVIHDALVHNSVLEGIKLSGAARRSFAHNDCLALDTLLSEIRGQFERVLVVVEGLYSMDGDIPDLPRLIDIKTRHKAFLMVDVAHSLGVLGQTGRGIAEHYGISSKAVDIWMGTLSKTLASCGGYIAGTQALIQNLKYSAPGFVYSVGIAPTLAACALEAIKIMLAEPERVARLRERGSQFLALAKQHGVDTGLSQGFAVTPAIIKSSLKAAVLSNRLFEQGLNVQPIIYPAVEERAARLRFFISSLHTEAQLRTAVELLTNG
ncbi:aminotransferase class I/II-fold pyridoxal phosphate-dependent enzyme [Rhodoferax antarcticus]|uniref:aminotransferase class I/II-fold pyridoxal phosphate-dependent enzyme n=1 Tax=Rhodoferax antarcticus TaxID=81479 RepID=UPI0022244D16|nr:aminotransferase class I/II-fold pyridoxal phosphate-dependent enzyme [Rhodoferax antarcticus]MCW2314215.1 8-amino-7-oxononanoate synthase [Rhodoferax antarcticus]